jgi:Glycosyl transferases group 1
VDIIMPNAERELAFPSRTVFYLWCGLPVIHPAYSEVAHYIRDYEAGWVVQHDNLDELRSVVISILANPQEARRRGENAQRLVREHFTWDSTIADLEKFVRQPYMRSERRRMLLASKSTRGVELASTRTAHTGPPAGYVITDPWETRLSPKLESVYGKRRTIGAQLGSRSVGLLRALTPARGSRTRPAAVNGRMRFALPELVAGHSQGQRFRSDHNGLSGIRVVLATLGRRNTSRLVLHLRTNPGAAGDIYSINLPAHKLREGQMVAFRFPPVPDSANRWFYFVADSPDGASGDAVSLYAVSRVEDMAAQRYEDGLPAEGSLLMSLEYNGVAV